MCIDFLNGTLWVRFHGWCWYQSFIDGSNIWGVDRTDPWGPEMDHPPLGRSYLVVVPSYDMSCALMSMGKISWHWYQSFIDGSKRDEMDHPPIWVRFHGWCWYQSFIDGSNIWGVDRTDPSSAIGPQLFGSSTVVWYALISFIYG